MQAYFQIPNTRVLNQLLSDVSNHAFSYKAIGGTQKPSIEGYDNDLLGIRLGAGSKVWQKAKEVLDQWQQFPITWTSIFPERPPLKKNTEVLVLFRLFGLWWINPSRIVYTIDEPNRYGFAYGTLDGHVERGEECFWIERDQDGSIYYNIKAFSKPQFWGAKLIYPIARSYQRRFVQESMARMKALTL